MTGVTEMDDAEARVFLETFEPIIVGLAVVVTVNRDCYICYEDVVG